MSTPATIETYSLHYDPQVWQTRRTHSWWRQTAARFLPAAQFGGWVLADAYGNFVTYAEGPRLDAAQAQHAAEETIAGWTYPHLPRSRWTRRESGYGVELYTIAITLISEEPPTGTVLRSAAGTTSYVRADALVEEGAPTTHRWFAAWTTRTGELAVHSEGESWAGTGAPLGPHGPRVGATRSLEEAHGPFTPGDPALYDQVVDELRARHTAEQEADDAADRARAAATAEYVAAGWQRAGGERAR